MIALKDLVRFRSLHACFKEARRDTACGVRQRNATSMSWRETPTGADPELGPYWDSENGSRSGANAEEKEEEVAVVKVAVVEDEEEDAVEVETLDEDVDVDADVDVDVDAFAVADAETLWSFHLSSSNVIDEPGCCLYSGNASTVCNVSPLAAFTFTFTFTFTLESAPD